MVEQRSANFERYPKWHLHDGQTMMHELRLCLPSLTCPSSNRNGVTGSAKLLVCPPTHTYRSPRNGWVGDLRIENPRVQESPEVTTLLPSLLRPSNGWILLFHPNQITGPTALPIHCGIHHQASTKGEKSLFIFKKTRRATSRERSWQCSKRLELVRAHMKSIHQTM